MPKQTAFAECARFLVNNFGSSTVSVTILISVILCIESSEDVGSAPVPATAPLTNGTGEPHPPKKTGTKITYEDYKHIANILVLYMRRREEEAAEGMVPRCSAVSA